MDQKTADEYLELVQKSTYVIQVEGKVSLSLLMRRLSISYTRAAKVLDILEENGIVGPGVGAAPRDILVDLNNLSVTVQKVAKNEISEADHSKGTEFSEEGFQVALAELEQFIGLESVKSRLKELATLARVQQMRRKAGLQTIKTSLHSVYMGNPGTGKTTIARIMAKLYKSLGILKRGHLIECDRSQLVAEYIGQTAVKTNKVIDTALDGVLFIDEAYSLDRHDSKSDYGREAIDTLLKRMEDSRDRLVVIVAGYTDEMRGFLETNPGLQSRFPNHVVFPDYLPGELCRVFLAMARDNGLNCKPELKRKLLVHYTLAYRLRDARWGNARDVRNLFENAVTRQATRISAISDFSRAALIELREQDIFSTYESEYRRLTQVPSAFVVKCPDCNTSFAWDPNSSQSQGQCTSCNTIFSVEFGELADGV